MKKIIYVLGLLAVINPAMADIKVDMLHDKMDRMEKDIAILQRKAYQQTNTGQHAYMQNAPYQAPAQLDDVYNKLNEQSAIIKELTAKIEQLEYQSQSFTKKLNQMNDDIDIRFNMINTTPAPTATPATDSAAYSAAYDLLQAGKLVEAENAFFAFMDKYPNSTLLGNANYWLGETYYARGKYAEAIGIFADGITKYKNNAKAPDNLLKLGLCMAQLKKKTEACTAFQSVKAEYPKAAASIISRAASEAKKLGCK